jgi:hypothetical protein
VSRCRTRRAVTVAMRLGALLVLVGAAGVSCHGDLKFDELTVCVQDPDCVLPTLHCNSGTCVACTADAHCKAAGYPRCDATLHRCVECSVAADCGTGRVRHDNFCAIPCSAGCPASAPICDDVCSACDDNVGCQGSPAGPICFEHVCGTCRDDTACGGGTPRCDPVTHDCVQCRTNADCPSARPICDIGVGACAALP